MWRKPLFSSSWLILWFHGGRRLCWKSKHIQCFSWWATVKRSKDPFLSLSNMSQDDKTLFEKIRIKEKIVQVHKKRKRNTTRVLSRQKRRKRTKPLNDRGVVAVNRDDGSTIKPLWNPNLVGGKFWDTSFITKLASCPYTSIRFHPKVLASWSFNRFYSSPHTHICCKHVDNPKLVKFLAVPFLLTCHMFFSWTMFTPKGLIFEPGAKNLPQHCWWNKSGLENTRWALTSNI